MSEGSWFGFIATILIIIIGVGMIKQCEQEHAINMKCVETTGNPQCEKK